MIHAYRLVYPISEHAPPQLWEYKQPYIDNLLRNARTFDRWVVQWYFEDWKALDRDNTRIWNTYYRPKPLFDHLPTWQEWLPEYRQPIIEVQDRVKNTKPRGLGGDNRQDSGITKFYIVQTAQGLRRSHSRIGYALQLKRKPKRLDIGWRGIVCKSVSQRSHLA